MEERNLLQIYSESQETINFLLTVANFALLEMFWKHYNNYLAAQNTKEEEEEIIQFFIDPT